ncbi:D-hexose-6-phosphate mutarotase [Bordetella sp. 2513F-2]
MTPSLPRIDPERAGQLECWRVQTPHGTALMARQGAQLLSYATADGRPVVWLSERADLSPGTPVRGGVPVCWPWFGVYARNPQAVRDTVEAPEDAPSHGLVRARDWTLTSQAVRGDMAELVFDCHLPEGLGPWRHPVRLTLSASFGQTVRLALTTENLGARPLTLSLALHTYLAVSDSRQVSVTGLEGLPYLDTTQDWQARHQDGPVRIDGETDRIYLGVDRPVEIHDPQWQRTLRLSASGSRSAVVWNPWVDKAARLSDFAPDAWQRMLCVETARIMDDVLELAPGTAETVAVEIAVVPAAGPAAA